MYNDFEYYLRSQIKNAMEINGLDEGVNEWDFEFAVDEELKRQMFEDVEPILSDYTELWDKFSTIKDNKGFLTCQVLGDVSVDISEDLERIKIENAGNNTFEFVSDCGEYIIRITPENEISNTWFTFSILKSINNTYGYILQQ